jgi:hypothetical protein
MYKDPRAFMEQRDIPGPSEIPVVGIGYSAGGLETARLILSKLPSDMGLAIVVIQHLQADYESHLAEILAKTLKMAVRTIENGMRVEANTVFVIPPAYDVVLNGDFLNLHRREEANVHHLGIDFFFSSLSQNRKSKAIGVVVSCTGSDGTFKTPRPQSLTACPGVPLLRESRISFSPRRRSQLNWKGWQNIPIQKLFFRFTWTVAISLRAQSREYHALF